MNDEVKKEGGCCGSEVKCGSSEEKKKHGNESAEEKCCSEKKCGTGFFEKLKNLFSNNCCK